MQVFGETIGQRTTMIRRKKPLHKHLLLMQHLLYCCSSKLSDIVESSSDDNSDEDELPRFTDVEVEHSISLGIKKYDFGAPDRTCKYCGAIVCRLFPSRKKGI
ncbi:hypothetical protein MKW92_042368 [Papaver armeniacum]|nr:hypothetical protein MKW92_042368 [Papaver armeniacum]